MKYIKLKWRFNFLFFQFLKLEKENMMLLKLKAIDHQQYSTHLAPFDFF